MTYPKPYNTNDNTNAPIFSCRKCLFARRIARTIPRRINRGMILVDIMVALTLATLFVIVVAELSGSARDVFDGARERDYLLNVFEKNKHEVEGMMPYESRVIPIDSVERGYMPEYATTTLAGFSHWYGNEMIQTDVTVYTDIQSIDLTLVNPYPFAGEGLRAGTLLCSVDFSLGNVVGSYEFTRRNRERLAGIFKSDPRVLTPKITPIQLQISSSLLLTDFEIRNSIAYLSTDTTTQSDPDVIAVDIRDVSDAFMISGVNTGPGIASIAVTKEKLYAAVTSTVAQFQIVDIKDTNNISLLSSYKLPLPYATATPARGSAVFYDAGYVFLGTEKWDGEEFAVIDVSDPASPVKIGGFETDSKINDIYVQDNVAYIAASDEEQLQALDIGDPSDPVLIDSFSPSGWDRQEGRSLSIFENSLSFGRTSGGFNIKKDHELFWWASSSVPIVSSAGETISQDVTGGVYGIIMDRSFVYMASRQLGSELRVADHYLSSSTVRNISLPALPQTLTCDRNYLYVLAMGSPIMYQIEF